MMSMGVLGVAVFLLGILARAAYRRGRREARQMLPSSVLEELWHHKRDCLGEPPERVALELSLLFGIECSPTGPERDGAPS